MTANTDMCFNVWHRLTCESFIWLKVNSSLQIIWMISLFFILIINYYVFMMLLFLLDIYVPTNIVDVWEFILFPLSGKKDQLVLCYTLAERLTSVWSRGHKCCIFYSLLAVMSSNNCVRSFNSWPLFLLQTLYQMSQSLGASQMSPKQGCYYDHEPSIEALFWCLQCDI